MKKNREMYVLYQNAVMCRLISMTVINNEKTAKVMFDNGEVADVPHSDIAMTFDLSMED